MTEIYSKILESSMVDSSQGGVLRSALRAHNYLLLLTTYYSLLTTYYLLLTTYYLLRTTTTTFGALVKGITSPRGHTQLRTHERNETISQLSRFLNLRYL